MGPFAGDGRTILALRFAFHRLKRGGTGSCHIGRGRISGFMAGGRSSLKDRGQRPGLTTDEQQRLKALEREVQELRRANEILRKASAYVAQAELDRRGKW